MPSENESSADERSSTATTIEPINININIDSVTDALGRIWQTMESQVPEVMLVSPGAQTALERWLSGTPTTEDIVGPDYAYTEVRVDGQLYRHIDPNSVPARVISEASVSGRLAGCECNMCDAHLRRALINAGASISPTSEPVTSGPNQFVPTFTTTYATDTSRPAPIPAYAPPITTYATGTSVPPATSDPTPADPMPDGIGGTTTRYMLVRAALRRGAGRDELRALGYYGLDSVDAYWAYTKQRYALTSDTSLRIVVPMHQNYAKDYDCARYNGFDDGVSMSMTTFTPDLVRIEPLSSGVFRCALPNDMVGYTFPWWCLGADGPEDTEEAAEARRERMRSLARNRVFERLANYATQARGRRQQRVKYKTILDASTSVGSIGMRRRITGVLFDWMRKQKAWSREAVMRLLINDVKNTDKTYVKETRRMHKRHPEFGNYGDLGSYFDRTHATGAGRDLICPDHRITNYSNHPWADTWWWRRCHVRFLHMIDVGKDDRMLLSYYPSEEKFNRNQRATMKPGRYLKKYFGIGSCDAILPVLTDEEIQNYAQQWEQENCPVVVHFKDDNDPDGWEWVYSNERGFDSCMSKGCHSLRGPQAVRIYAKEGNGLRLAYITDTGEPDGNVTARTVVNGKTNKRARVYGDNRLNAALDAMGIPAEHGALMGVELALIEYDSENFYLPYIDGGIQSGGGSLSVRFNKDKTALITCEHNGEPGVVEGNRYSTALVPKSMLSGGRFVDDDDDYDGDDNTVDCDLCGRSHDGYTVYWSQYHEQRIGPCCIDDYCRAYTSTTRARERADWVHESEVFQHGDDYYLLDSDVLEVNGFRMCDVDDEWYPEDELTCVAGDRLVHDRHIVELDVPHDDGSGGQYDFACRGDVTTLADGRVVYEDDAVQDDLTGEFHLVDETYSVGMEGVYGTARLDLHASTIINLADYADRFSVKVRDGAEHIIYGRPEGATKLTDRLATGVPFTKAHFMRIGAGDACEGEHAIPCDLDGLFDDDDAAVLNHLFNLTGSDDTTEAAEAVAA